jgi:hypothetical protein
MNLSESKRAGECAFDNGGTLMAVSVAEIRKPRTGKGRTK